MASNFFSQHGNNKNVLKNRKKLIKICIIKATPGPDTKTLILKLLRQHPFGMTVTEISQALNRPVSMVNICLRELHSLKEISPQADKRRWSVYAVSRKREK
uniref:Uncharacterized protein n=1 Tax=Gloeothece verrucosa (strain PCC 7822) TaxID=497965 RepID=E0UN50_GLOV7|nr:hypothetical protein Cyan7822_6629 [Gloeothece verrucosa PCC 7822]